MPLLESTTTVDATDQFDRADVVVLPTGSVEQHGPALPLKTDCSTAETVGRSVEDREDVLVLPTVPVGVSEHHRQFHGTLWVDESTFERYVTEVLEAAFSHGPEKAVIVNGHGGNVAAIERVAAEFYRDERGFVVPWSWWEGVSDDTRDRLGDDVEVPGHAGLFEAAAMLQIDESSVRTDRFDEVADYEQRESRWSGSPVRGFDLLDWTESGVHGDPAGATAEMGADLVSDAADSLEELVEWLADESASNLRPRGHK